jgi:PAS domain S-box-containing protein
MGNAILVLTIIIILGTIILANARSMNKAASRRRVMEELKLQSEEKYRNILGNIEEGYFETDLKGNLTFFNDALCTILGYGKDEAQGMSYRQYVDREAGKKLLATMLKIFKTGEPVSHLDWEITRKDNTRRCVESSISLIRNTAEEPIGFRGLVRDITERKLAAAALSKSEEENRELIENASDAIYTLNLSGDFTSLNRAGEQILGYTRAE